MVSTVYQKTMKGTTVGSFLCYGSCSKERRLLLLKGLKSNDEKNVNRQSVVHTIIYCSRYFISFSDEVEIECSHQEDA